MLNSGAFVNKSDLLEYLEKRLSYFVLAGEYELEPSLPENPGSVWCLSIANYWNGCGVCLPIA